MSLTLLLTSTLSHHLFRTTDRQGLSIGSTGRPATPCYRSFTLAFTHPPPVIHNTYLRCVTIQSDRTNVGDNVFVYYRFLPFLGALNLSNN
jgi:hypothetical protein